MSNTIKNLSVSSLSLTFFRWIDTVYGLTNNIKLKVMSWNRESVIIGERLLGITIQLKKQKHGVKVAFIDITKILVGRKSLQNLPNQWNKKPESKCTFEKSWLAIEI